MHPTIAIAGLRIFDRGQGNLYPVTWDDIAKILFVKFLHGRTAIEQLFPESFYSIPSLPRRHENQFELFRAKTEIVVKAGNLAGEAGFLLAEIIEGV